jgi:hypothetical protein
MKAPSRKAIATPVRATAQGLLVLGMHRSGTSAATRVLNLLGCALPANLIGAGDGNELGHWESINAVTLNDQILASAGSSWEDWGPINQDWRESGLRADAVARVTAVIQEHAALGPLFALKDPRLCRLADLWLEGMEGAGVKPLVLMMIRNPLEVVASLENRDLMAPGYGQLLWLRHMLDAEYFSRDHRRIVVRYDQLLQNWYGVIDRVKSGLGVALPRNSPAVHAEVDVFLSWQQRHHEANLDAALNNPALSNWLRRTFSILLEWSEGGENKSDHTELDTIRQEFDRSYAAFARLLLTENLSGDVGSGSRLKRELAAQMTESQHAAEAARISLQEADARQTAALAREAELQALIEAASSEAQLRQAEIERLHTLAAETDALRQRETELAADLAGLEAELADSRARIEQERQERLAAEQQRSDLQAVLHDLELRNAELAGRATAGESALLQRQEELAQLWNQLLAAEKATATADMLSAQERERRIELERENAAAAATISDLQSRLERASAPAPADHLFAEITQLTRMLQEQEAATTAARDKIRVVEQDLENQNKESGLLAERLQAQERATRSAEQKLTTRFDEIARLTNMLADENRRAGALAANTEWMASMARISEGFPGWWRLMPLEWRRQREHARYRQAGLFDAAKYLELYPDVAENGMDPVRHYMLHGMAEGRQRPQ